MKYKLLVLLLVFSSSCASPRTSRESIEDPGQLLFNGYVYEDVSCYDCHGGDGSGTWKGSDLVGLSRIKSRAEIVAAIQLGAGSMPPYGDLLESEELDQVVDWLETLK